MLDIFNHSIPTVEDPHYSNLQPYYKNLDAQIMNNGGLYLPNSNFFIILTSLIANPQLPMMTYYKQSFINIHSYLRQNRHTGIDSAGVIKPSVIFDKSVNEAICYDTSYPDSKLFDPGIFDPYVFTPAKMLSHPFSRLDIFFLDGSVLPNASEDAMSYLQINIGELILAYRVYYLNLMGQAPSVSTFVSTYILLPLFKSYAEIAMFNYFHATILGKPIDTKVIDNRFGYSFKNRKIINGAMKYVYKSNKKRLPVDILKMIPTAQGSLSFPVLDMPTNNVNVTFSNMSRLDTLIKVSELLPERERLYRNRDIRQTLVTRFKRNFNEEFHVLVITPKLKDSVQDKVNYLLELYGEKPK